MTSQSMKVLAAIEAVADPLTSHEKRAECTRMLEELKEGDSSLLLSVSLELLSTPHLQVIHVAFNLIYHAVAFKWKVLSVAERMSLRDELLGRLRGAPGVPLEGPSTAHWAEPLARCILAMMEHEWPQQWPDCIDTLLAIAAESTLSAVNVLAVLRRCVEDVVVLARVENVRRRKEMHSGIHDNLRTVLPFLLKCLALSPADSGGRLLSKYCLSLLALLADTATPADIEPHVERIFDLVVSCLNVAEHNVYEEAARCLTAFAGRKRSSASEVAIVSSFFKDNVIKTILETTSLAANVAHSSESHYKYLKALSETLTTVGLHLSSSWNEKSSPPANFRLFLDALRQFFVHPAITLRSESAAVLCRFALNAAICSHGDFHAAIASVIPSIPCLLQKTGFPSETPMTDSSHYSRMDFDDDIEWSHDFTQYRTRMLNLTRDIVETHLNELFSLCQQWIFTRIIPDPNSLEEKEWEPMHRFVKTVVLTAAEKNLLQTHEMDALQRAFLGMLECIATKASFSSANEALSVVSALLPVLHVSPHLLDPLVDVLQKLLLESPEEEKPVKRHCTSFLIRVISVYPEAARANCQRIFDACQAVTTNASVMQQAQIANVLAALSNLAPSVEVQRTLLDMALRPHLTAFYEIKSVIVDVESFINATGFSSAPPSSGEEEAAHSGVNLRKTMRSVLSALEGIAQKVPSDSIVGDVLVQECETFARLAKILFELYSAETLSRVHPAYGALLDIPYTERQAIYCSVGESLEASTGRKASDIRSAPSLAVSFLSEINDALQSLLSICATKFSSKLFAVPNISLLVEMTTVNMENVPDYRIRYWLKKAWPAFLTSCPVDQLSSVQGLLTRICTHMHSRLINIWQKVSSVDYESGEPTDEELFVEHMACVLSREYALFLRTVFLHPDAPHQPPSDDRRGSLIPALSAVGEATFNEWGGDLLRAFISTVFSALSWRDTQTALKSISIARAIVDKLSTSCFAAEVAEFALRAFLRSIEMYGSDEVASGPLLGLIFHSYLSLRPHSAALLAILQELPDTPQASIDHFEKKVAAIRSGLETVPEKARRDMTKKLLRPIISLTMGEMHRRPVELRPLPPIEKRAKPKPEPDFQAIADFFAHDGM